MTSFASRSHRNSHDGSVYFGGRTMFGRLRTFRHLGGEVRAEFANTPLAGSVTQDIQMGIRYEYQDMSNRNFLGNIGRGSGGRRYGRVHDLRPQFAGQHRLSISADGHQGG